MRQANKFVRELFLFNLEDIDDDHQLKENLTELRADQAVRTDFGERRKTLQTSGQDN